MEETNLDVVSGDSFAYTWTFYDSLTDLPLPLTGASGYFTIKEHEEDADVDAVLDKIYSSVSPLDGVMIYSATSGEMTLPEGQYYYAMKIKIGPSVYTFLYGTINIRAARKTVL